MRWNRQWLIRRWQLIWGCVSVRLSPQIEIRIITLRWLKHVKDWSRYAQNQFCLITSSLKKNAPARVPVPSRSVKAVAIQLKRSKLDQSWVMMDWIWVKQEMGVDVSFWWVGIHKPNEAHLTDPADVCRTNKASTCCKINPINTVLHLILFRSCDVSLWEARTRSIHIQHQKMKTKNERWTRWVVMMMIGLRRDNQSWSLNWPIPCLKDDET